ncbi:hypothetical protein AUP68_15516 [Ilyonectria robusta]
MNRPEDSEYEVSCMSPGVGELDIYPSIWGHWAGGPPGNMDDVRWLDERLAKILAEAPVNDLVAKLEKISIKSLVS